MAVPLFEFHVTLRWRYGVRVTVWETWREMCDAAGETRRRARYAGWFFPREKKPGRPRGRTVGDIYLCRANLDDGTIVHELKHAVWWFERRNAHRFRDLDRRDEAMAQALERAFVATRDHIRDEMRRLEQAS